MKTGKFKTKIKPLYTLIFLFTLLGFYSCTNHVQKGKDKKHNFFVEDSIVDQLINHPEKINVNQFIQQMDTAFGSIDNAYYDYKVKVFNVNFDADKTAEIIVYCTSKKNFSCQVYILKKKISRYYLAGSINYSNMNAWENIEPILDLEHKTIWTQGRISGTCDFGFEWCAYQLHDKKLKNVVCIPGTHEITSCGTMEDPRDNEKYDYEHFSEIATDFELKAKDTIVVRLLLTAGEIEFNNANGTNKMVHYDQNKKPIILFYIYDRKLKQYEIFNTDFKRIEHAMINMASEIDLLYNEGRL